MHKQIVSLDFMPNTFDETPVVQLNPLAKPIDLLAEAAKRLMMLKATLMISADRSSVESEQLNAQWFYFSLAQMAHEAMTMVDDVVDKLTSTAVQGDEHE